MLKSSKKSSCYSTRQIPQKLVCINFKKKILMLKIAIYSGTIPSTTFIERLIVGLSGRNVTIYLFGIKTESKSYLQKNIVVSTYSGKINKFFRLIWFSLLLFLFRNSEKKQLDKWISSRKGNSRMFKVKCYPVLWYKPDLFHLQWAKSIDDWIWVQDFGIKLVVSLRGNQINIEPLIDTTVAGLHRTSFPKVDGFHAVSKVIGKQAERYGAQSEKIKVIYSGLPGIKNSNKIESNYLQSETLQILSVGRSHWVKGYSYALDACVKLKNKGVNFHYTVIGARNVEELEYHKNNLGLTEFVTFSEKVNYEKVIETMQNAHIVLLPSIEEGIANVVLEAMQLGKLVITTNCGGMEEVVKDGVNGFIVPIRNAEAIAQKIIEISTLSQIQVNEIAAKARETIEAIHSEEKMVEDMKKLYDFVLEKKVLL